MAPRARGCFFAGENEKPLDRMPVAVLVAASEVRRLDAEVATRCLGFGTLHYGGPAIHECSEGELQAEWVSHCQSYSRVLYR